MCYYLRICQTRSYYIQEEAECISIWGLIERRVNDRDIRVWLEDMPHQNTVKELLVDGNQTCEDAAYNHCESSKENDHLSSRTGTPEPDRNLSAEDTLKESNDDTRQLTEAEYTQKANHIIEIANHAARLNESYPAVLDANLPPVDIPDAAIKNSVSTAVRTYGKVSTWVAMSTAEAMDDYSAANVYINVTQSLKALPDISTLEIKVYTHMATPLSIINSVNVTVCKCAAQGKTLDYQLLLNSFINGEFYDETYKRFF